MQLLVFYKRKINLVIVCCVILILLFYFAYAKLETLSALSGSYYMVHTEQKVVALTFDDGPDPPFTEPILDILKAKNVKATFFVIGENVHQNPSLLLRMVKEGHEIGNHSFTHNNNQGKLINEIQQTDREVYTATGIHTHFYRPPGGFASNTLVKAINNQGYIFTLWSIDSKDWRRPGVDRIIKNVVSNISPGSIILLHDGGGFRSQTVKALGQIIDVLQADGYRFVTLSELRSFDSVSNEKVFNH